jgi:peptide-methionine (S)-S-oxide reductase
MPIETAILAGGCFWCLEAVLDRLRGVQSVESGYIGGHVKNPAYREVCAGTTGHAEAIRLTFDPAEISFADLLEVFFAIHDPTTKDRQGNDVGTQYRSAIFYTSDEQKQAAEEKIKELVAARAFAFYEAEGYHQEYFENNPTQPYCQMIVAPKVRKALEKFGEKMAR